MERNGKKVLVAMSGGVDSSVAAFLLKKDGYEVSGAHMVCWEGCDTNEDRRDAMRVADKLEIPFHVFDFTKEYKEKVFEYMVREYGAGRTPNPDVMCNSEIKFGIFLERAIEMGFDYVATGHYARLKEFPISNSKFPNIKNSLKIINYKLKIARDLNKDQTYFLWRLNHEQLSRALFPIGDYLKSEVREIAKDAGLITASKKDSQGLCFVGKIDFQDFIREYLPKEEGNFIDPEGKILGRHDGAYFFTPGQRHGIKLGGFKEPLYVAETNGKTNTVLVAEGFQNPALYKKEIFVMGSNLFELIPDKFFARIRYRQPLQAASFEIRGSGMKVIFEKPQRGVAPGQSIVFYDGNAMIGGAIIKK